jgi:menaquinol-cytochrome c reductase iron-sulfur subunit
MKTMGVLLCPIVLCGVIIGTAAATAACARPETARMTEPRRHRHRSKYTQDRQLPGAFEGETVTRRRFMAATAGTAGTIAAAAFTLPALGFAIAPLFEQTPGTWQEVGPVSHFTSTDYSQAVITIEPDLGQAGLSTAFIRLHNLAIDGPIKDRYDHVVAISSRCVHVGCPVRYVASAQSFVCPCHAGVYNIRGIRVGGPPPRPLDRFYTLIRDERVLVGPRYSVNNQLRRFSPRDPGEPLNGIGQFLYPARPSTPPAPPGATS